MGHNMYSFLGSMSIRKYIKHPSINTSIHSGVRALIHKLHTQLSALVPEQHASYDEQSPCTC